MGKRQSAAPGGPPGAPPKRRASLPLKVFVLFMAIGLVAIASLGLYIAFKNIRMRKITWTLLTLGTVLPVALIFL